MDKFDKTLGLKGGYEMDKIIKFLVQHIVILMVMILMLYDKPIFNLLMVFWAISGMGATIALSQRGNKNVN